MLSVVVFFSTGLMQLLYSPPFLLPIPPYSRKYISDKQGVFGYLETHNPRHELCSAGDVSDKPRLSEIERRNDSGSDNMVFSVFWTSGGIRAKTCGFAQQENFRVNQQPDVDF
jgi:hypothetical protein